MQERNALDDQLNAIGRIERDLADQITMIELGDAEKDQRVVAEAEAVLKALKAEAARRELEALLIFWRSPRARAPVSSQRPSRSRVTTPMAG